MEYLPNREINEQSFSNLRPYSLRRHAIGKYWDWIHIGEQIPQAF